MPGTSVQSEILRAIQDLHTQSGDVPAAVEWLPDNSIRLVDQTLLPTRLVYLVCTQVAELAHAIKSLKVRGAPAIGVAAAYGLALSAHLSEATSTPDLLNDLERDALLLRLTRPTAVNLAWALDTVMSEARSASGAPRDLKGAVLEAARRIDLENKAANTAIGEYGATLFSSGSNLLTHCNAGPLATGGVGTALGAIYTAHKGGKRLHVWVDETRPLLQGARITAWELGSWGVPHTLITDNMAASLMQAGRVDAVIVGADRIARNGDFANKIGTYGLAVLARAHGIPFYCAAPISTIDFNIADGSQIEIEERNPQEVSAWSGVQSAPEGVAVYNPAFDVTPASLVTAIVTERGILEAPFSEAIARLKTDISNLDESSATIRGGV